MISHLYSVRFRMMRSFLGRIGLAYRNQVLRIFLLVILPAIAASRVASSVLADEDAGASAIASAELGVVTVLVYRSDDITPSVGSGFLITPDRVITARHALVRGQWAEVQSSKGLAIRVAGILDENRPNDLILLQLVSAFDNAKALKVASAIPEPGQRLYALSAPLGLEFTATSGVVSAFRDLPGVGVVMQHTVPTSRGSSGCALLNEHGDVVGVALASVNGGEALNFGVPASAVLSLRAGRLRTLKDSAIESPPNGESSIDGGLDRLSLVPLVRDDFPRAISFFEKRVRADPRNADAWFRMAFCFQRAGADDRAISAYRTAISLDPTSAPALNNLACIYTNRGEQTKAIELLQKAVKLKPDYSEAWSDLAVALVEDRNWTGAFEAAQEAVRLDSKNAEAHLNLGTAALELGKRDEADRQYDLLMQADVPRGRRLRELLGGGARFTTATEQRNVAPTQWSELGWCVAGVFGLTLACVLVKTGRSRRSNAKAA